MRNVVDLAAFATERKVELGLGCDLAELCVHLLGQTLAKERHVRKLKWNQVQLTDEQKRVAQREKDKVLHKTTILCDSKYHQNQNQ